MTNPRSSAESDSDEKTKVSRTAFPESDALSNIRHSLRTPLNQIIGYSEMLQEEAADQGQIAYLADLQKIHTAGGQLLALVNEGLAPWKLETGKIDLDMMRHEMRTPLNLIIGYSELCEEVAVENKIENFVDDLKKISSAAKNLLQLFDSPEFPTQLEVSHLARKPPRRRAVPEEGLPISEKGVIGRETSLLIVDDNEGNRDMLSRRLERQGYVVATAGDGQQALDAMKNQSFDLVLLDVLMPVMDGLETLSRLKMDDTLKHVPVIMLSALDEIDGAVRCIEVGAEDYLPKPFNPVLLQARISASLEKKRLRDREQAYLEQLEMEREKAERMLLNILPKSIADRLKAGESTIADSFKDATVLFADLENFTKIATGISPADLVHLLNDIFSGFDWLAELHGLEKIKTIGDAYMVAGGLPNPRPDHASSIAEMALEMQKVIKRFNTVDRTFNLRIGISTGPVIAGVIGRKKFIYDLWGDTVNLASRMESQGQPGRIQVSASTYERLKNKYTFQKRGVIDVKGKGEMTTYFLTGKEIH